MDRRTLVPVQQTTVHQPNPIRHVLGGPPGRDCTNQGGQVIEFHDVESFKMPGGGLIFSVFNPIECERNNNTIFGAVVRINGLLYHVKGIESFAVSTLRVGTPLGLLVRLYLGKGIK